MDMNNFINAVGEISDEYIEEFLSRPSKKNKLTYVYSVVAAVFLISILIFFNQHFHKSDILNSAIVEVTTVSPGIVKGNIVCSTQKELKKGKTVYFYTEQNCAEKDVINLTFMSYFELGNDYLVFDKTENMYLDNDLVYRSYAADLFVLEDKEIALCSLIGECDVSYVYVYQVASHEIWNLSDKLIKEGGTYAFEESGIYLIFMYDEEGNVIENPYQYITICIMEEVIYDESEENDSKYDLLRLSYDKYKCGIS